MGTSTKEDNNNHGDIEKIKLIGQCLELDANLTLTENEIAETLKEQEGDILKSISNLKNKYAIRSPFNKSQNNQETLPSLSQRSARKRGLWESGYFSMKKRRDREKIAEKTVLNSEDRDDVIDVTSRMTAMSLITEAVKSMSRSFPLADDWRNKICDALGANPSTEVLQCIHVACASMSSMQNTVQSPNKRSISQNAELLVDIIGLLPKTGNGDRLSNAVYPTDDTLSDLDVDALSALESLGGEKNESNTAESSNFLTHGKCVFLLNSACRGHLNRLECFRQKNEKLILKQQKYAEDCEKFKQRHKTLENVCTKELEGAKNGLGSAKKTKEEITVKMSEVINIRSEELKGNGESEISANTQAHLDMLQSKDRNIIALLASYESSKKRVDNEQGKLTGIQTYRQFLVECKMLFQKVSSRRNASMQEAKDHFLNARKEADEHASKQLMKYIPSLCVAISNFSSFHSKKQIKAQELLEAKRQDLETHQTLFNDNAPLDRRDMELRIREYQEIIISSTHEMKKLAENQSSLWSKHLHHLPPSVRDILVSEIQKLVNSLKGPIKDILSDIIHRERDANVSQSEVFSTNLIGSASDPITISPQSNNSTDGTSSTTSSAKKHSETKKESKAVSPKAVEPSKPLDGAPKNDTDETGKKDPVFSIGTRLHTKFIIGGKKARYFAGEVIAIHDDGTYTIRYEDGDIHRNVGRKFLYTDSELRALSGKTITRSKTLTKKEDTGCVIM